LSELLRIDDLAVELKSERQMRPILRGVSLSIDKAETVGLVGESGSGKSMTARAVMRLLPQGARVSGELLFDGSSIMGWGGAELLRWRANDVAMVFQDARVHVNPVRRIGDFLCEALVIARGVPREVAQERMVKGLEETGIEDAERRMRQYPGELSGGLLQRVMIAAAIGIEPRLLIADEPTSALDVTTQGEVMAILDGLRDSHDLSLLFITHDLDLAAAVCDRTAVMYAGRIVEVRPSAALHVDPLHPYTAALVASRPTISSSVQRLPAISGRPISASEVHTGCPFAPRCRYAEDRCWTETPPFRPFADGAVACHRAAELRGKLVETETEEPETLA
jgi:oligopeptide/dipeptide ABC transporter ATP-binding protein